MSPTVLGWQLPSLPKSRSKRVLVFAGFVLVLGVLSRCVFRGAPTAAATSEVIRVLIATPENSIRIRAQDLRCPRIGNVGIVDAIEVRTQAKGLLVIPLRDERQSDATSEPAFVLDDGHVDITWLGPATWTTGAARTASSTRQHFGRLTAHAADDGSLRCVLHAPLELYVTGVLAAEMGSSFPPAALAAQAIAARGFALTARARRQDSQDFDVFDDERDQVYRGVDASPPLIEAVRATTGLVLAYDGNVLRSYYASTCGGRTRDGYAFFRDVPRAPFRGVVCEACSDSPLYRWSRRIERGAFAELGCGRSGSLRFELFADDDRGDLEKIRVTGPHGSVIVPASSLSRLRPLPSRWIDSISDRGDDIEVRGRGFGHGVGLCQYGARGYARAGWSFSAILQHYFPGATITQLRDL
ncbi:MAG: SpoIID/LytB domain-containing protein [Planctomycetes bacterium]|nr:SpoIID/LytB domain-containing protein [Planctomycetota bacterium]